MSTLFDVDDALPSEPRPAPARDWVEGYQTKTGMPDPRTTGTTAQPRHCTTCGRLVLAGYDAPMLAGLAVTDPYPLTPALEAAAVILARPTWRVWGTPGRYELTHRTPETDPTVRLLGADRCVVVASHHCHHPPLARAPLPMRPPAWVVDSDGPPPF